MTRELSTGLIPIQRLNSSDDSRHKLIDACLTLESCVIPFVSYNVGKKALSNPSGEILPLGELINDHCRSVIGDEIRNVNWAIGIRNRSVHALLPGKDLPSEGDLARAAGHIIGAIFDFDGFFKKESTTNRIHLALREKQKSIWETEISGKRVLAAVGICFTFFALLILVVSLPIWGSVS